MPSLAKTMSQAVSGIVMVQVDGVACTKSPQSASPIERPIAKPPGQVRSGPTASPVLRDRAWASVPPAAAMRLASSVGFPADPKRWEVVRWIGRLSSCELPCEKPNANESPTFPHLCDNREPRAP